MTEHIINWFVDTMARTETQDLCFVIRDLVDGLDTPEELGEIGDGDNHCNDVVNNTKRPHKPIGKTVI